MRCHRARPGAAPSTRPPAQGPPPALLAAPGTLPPLPAGCGSATEAKAVLINYELKHFPSWLFTRAASLLIRNNRKERAFKAHLFRGTLIRCQLGAPQCAPGGLGLWLRGQTPLQTPNHSAPNYVRCHKASAITPGSSLQAGAAAFGWSQGAVRRDARNPQLFAEGTDAAFIPRAA